MCALRRAIGGLKGTNAYMPHAVIHVHILAVYYGNILSITHVINGKYVRVCDATTTRTGHTREVVEDNKSLRKLMKSFLTFHGFNKSDPLFVQALVRPTRISRACAFTFIAPATLFRTACACA